MGRRGQRRREEGGRLKRRGVKGRGEGSYGERRGELWGEGGRGEKRR